MVDAAARDAVWIDVLPSMRNFAPELAKGAGSAAEKEGKRTGQLYGKAMLAGVAVVAGGAALATKALVGVGATFDDMADTIRVGTGATGDQLDAMVESAKRVGTRVPAEFGEVGTALADVNTRLGHTGEPLEEMTEQFLELSRITGTDVATNIEKVSRVFGDWGIEADKQSESLDYLFKVSQSTGVGVDELSSKVVQFGAPMRQLGFSFEDSAALMGKWGKEGVNTETIMGGLRQGLGKMAKAGKEPAEEFKRVTEAIKNAGSEGEATQIAIETFGQRAGPDMAAAVREGRFELDELVGSLTESEETIMTAGAETMDYAEQWRMLQNDIMVLVAPAAEWLFEKLGEGMEWLQQTGIPTLKDFGTWLKDNKATLAALAVTVGVAVVAFGGMAIVKQVTTWLKAARGAVLAMNAAMRANPIGVVITAIGLLVAALIWLYQNNEDARRIMDAAWAKIKGAIDGVVKWFKNTAWPWMRDTFSSLSRKAGNVKDDIVDAWDKIRGGISSAWDKIKATFGKVKSGVDDVKQRFTRARDGIRDAWSALGGIIARPINTVIDSVNSFLNRLQRGINKIPGVNLGGTWGSIPNIPVPSSGPAPTATRPRYAMATGGVLPGYTPGRDVHTFYSPTAGILELSGGEPVMRPEFGRAVGTAWVDRMNWIARTQGVAGVRRAMYGEMSYASGGFIPGAPRRAYALGGFIPSLGDLLSSGAGMMRKLFDSVLPDWGGSWPGRVVSGLVSNLDLGKIATAVKDKALEALGASGGGGGGVNYGGRYGQHPSGMHWRNIWSMIRAAVPNAVMTSNFRGGAITASGIPSLHGLGRAVDWIVPGMGAAMRRAFNVVGQLMPWSQHFYTPAGPGAQHGYVDANIRRDHHDHAHTALKLGGWFNPSAFVADSGALLGQGLNLLDNRTGGPEPLRRADLPTDLSDETIEELREAFREVMQEAVRTGDRLSWQTAGSGGERRW